MNRLDEDLSAYLSLRRALGFALVGYDRVLERFVAHLRQRNETTVTVEAAVSFANGASSPIAARRRLMIVRGFAGYLRSIDGQSVVPPADLLPLRIHRATPYLYSPAQVAALRAAAADLGPSRRAATFTTLLGLLSVTGMRISEALALDPGDVDLASGVITVRESKFGRSRLVPLSASSTAALTSYLQLRQAFTPEPRSEALFVSTIGTRLGKNVAEQMFRRLTAAAGIEARAGGRRPRLHDFRHSFAVDSLLDAYRRGGDVQAVLPVLSSFLGHVDPKNTYWYLSGAPELLALAAERLEHHFGGES
jgi:integrase/recombinase XerD